MNGPLLRLGLLEMGISFLFGILSFLVGIQVFRRHLGVPDLWSRLVKGNNVALALLLASFLAGMLTLMNAGASAATEVAATAFDGRDALAAPLPDLGLRLVLIYLGAAGGSVVLLMGSLWLYDRHTRTVDELAAVRAGGVGSAVLLSSLCLSVFMLMERPFATLFLSLAPPARNAILGVREPFLNRSLLLSGLAMVALSLVAILALTTLGFRFLRALEPRADEAVAAPTLGLPCFVACAFAAFALFLRSALPASYALVTRLVQDGDGPAARIALDLLAALAVIPLALALGLLLAHLGNRILRRLTRGVDEDRALARGSLPVALVSGAFVLSLSLLMGDGVRTLFAALTTRALPPGGLKVPPPPFPGVR